MTGLEIPWTTSSTASMSATVYTASSMTTCRVQVGAEELECPAQDPDLNPIISCYTD